ncbi:hypothetical protein WJW27_004863 [Escherichia coli]
MENFQIPLDYDTAKEMVHKVHYIFNELIIANSSCMQIELKGINSEEVFLASPSSIIPLYGMDRLWFMRDAPIDRYKIQKKSENDFLYDYFHISLQAHDISTMSAEEYFQHSTVYSPEEIFVVMLVAKLSTVDFGTYPNKSFKIIIPAFVDLYDFIVHKKESTVYDMQRSNISLIAVSAGELK